MVSVTLLRHEAGRFLHLGSARRGGAARPIDRNQRRKRRRLPTVAEFQATTYEADFGGLAVDPGMEPARVSTGMGEQHDQRALLRRLEALLRPLANGTTIGRIAEHMMMAPILAQAILVLREVEPAL